VFKVRLVFGDTNITAKNCSMFVLVVNGFLSARLAVA
jgi:hypothetical protein